ncbi:unnamed protein product [Oppiella nova]|uniref:MD-2-related lipid-recognition domain-containing protein n=1 Tax=Oppiella nova TaxID=334625 RepID=A0A7R9QJ19_9ACAR|nr:unnamed protein product [Oppiella nova]CAG2166337.1 unnamed protein product [Oppiella nova]
MLKVVIISLVIILASASSPYKDCGHAEIKTLDISKCSKSPCEFHLDEQVTTDIEFTANQDTTKLTFGMTVDLGSGPVDITKYMPDFDNNGCHIVKCPVKKGDPLSIVYKAIEGNMTVTMKVYKKI